MLPTNQGLGLAVQPVNQAGFQTWESPRANFELGGRAAATAAANGPKSREISLPGAVTCARGIMITK